MGYPAAQGAILAIGIVIGLICSVIGLFFGHIILFDSIALGIVAGVCCNAFTPIHPALCLVIGIAVFLLLLWLQRTSVGFWVIGGLLTLIYATVAGLLPEAVGQLNMYLNYYAAEVNDPDDNPPIGIILCTDKTNVEAEYALGGLSNNIFASHYTYVIPNKEELIAQVEAVLREWYEPESDGEKED